ncbi:MAG: oligosaccharide flippase family protein [Emcibacter sp.]|nr:oligosaccharide flippase family protein [Emcibacter sp.]
MNKNNPANNQKDLLSGAGANLFGFVIRLGARLPFLLVVALLYGTEIFGKYLLAVTIVETLTAIILFGFKRSIFHFLYDDIDNGDMSGLFNSIMTAMVLCIVIAAILLIPIYIWHDFLYSFFPDGMAKGIFIILPTAFVYALTEILLTATRAARKMRYEVTAKSIIEPYVLLGFSAGLYALHMVESGLFIAYWMMNISIFIYAIYAFGKTYDTATYNWGRLSWVKIKSMASFSAPTAAYDLIGVIILRIDIYLLAAIVSPSALGVYGIALQIMTIIKKIRQSFDPILEPVISQTLKQSKLGNVNEELSRVSYWIFSIQALIFTLLIFYGAGLLGLFNIAGGNASLTLLFLIGAVMIQGSFGLSELLFIYKKPNVNLILSLVILLFHASLCYFLSLKFGILGAAISLVASYSFTEIIRLSLAKYFFGAIPLNRTIFKPVFMAAVLYGYLFFLSSFIELYSAAGLVLGIIGGIFMYFLIFFIIAQEEERFILMKKLRFKRL